MEQRIPYPKPEDFTDEQRQVADEISAGPRGQIRGPMLLWLHSPRLAASGQRVGSFLRWETVFDARLSELAILVTARHCNCHYVWQNHIKLAVDSGLSGDTLDAIKYRRTPTFQDEDERLVHDVATQLLKSSDLIGETVEAARLRFGDRGLVELTAIVGYYQMGMYTLAAARVPLIEGGWTCLPD